MVTNHEEEKKVGELINDLKFARNKLELSNAQLSSLLSSFSRVYKETTKETEDWKGLTYSYEDFTQRLQEFEQKLHGTFNGKSTLSVYKTRAKKLAKIAELFLSKDQSLRNPGRPKTAQNTKKSTREANVAAEEMINKLSQALTDNDPSYGLYVFPLSESKKAFLLIPDGKSGIYLKQVKSILENIIQALEANQ